MTTGDAVNATFLYLRDEITVITENYLKIDKGVRSRPETQWMKMLVSDFKEKAQKRHGVSYFM